MRKKCLPRLIVVGAFVVFILLCFACATSNSIIRPGVDFSKYVFAAMKLDTSLGSNALAAQQILQGSLEYCGFNVIGETRIGTLSNEDQSKAFIATLGTRSSTSYYYNQYGEGSITTDYFTINIADYVSGSIIASFEGSGHAYYNNYEKAFTKALEEMEKVIRSNRQIQSPTFPSEFIGTWERAFPSAFINTLTFTSTTLKASNQKFYSVIQNVSGDVYTLRIPPSTGYVGSGIISIKLNNGNLDIMDNDVDSKNTQDDWTGTWKRK